MIPALVVLLLLGGGGWITLRGEGALRRVEISRSALEGAGPVRVVLAAEPLRERARAELNEILQERQPDVLRSFIWGTQRYENPRLVVTDVVFRARPEPDRVGVVASGYVESDREKAEWVWRGAESGFRWKPDGTEKVSDVRLRGHVLLRADGQRSLAERPLQALFRSERIEGILHLRGASGVGFGFDDARTLHAERPELVDPAEMPEARNLHLGGVRVEAVSASEVVLAGTVERNRVKP